MKKIILIGLLISTVLLMSSCESFLTETNPNAMTSGSFWKTEADALQGLGATYAVLQYSHVMGANEVMASVRTDVARSNPWDNTLLSLQDFSYNETNDYLTKKWNQLYIGVFRANQVLEFVPKMAINEKVKASILAEAHFLRGLYFFWLMNTYNNGSIPLPTSFPKELNDYNKPLSSKEQVYTQVWEDLNYAATSPALPAKWDDQNIGRITWGAAQGILAQLYVYEQKWPEAVDQLKKIIERTDLYSLVSDINWNFDGLHEWNSESIFEVNFSDVVRLGNNAYVVDDPKGAEATTRAMNLAISDNGGWGVMLPSAWVRKLYMDDPVDTSDPSNAGRKYSKRCEASIYFHSAGYPFYVLPEGKTELAFSSIPVNACIKKFQNWQGKEKEDVSLIRSGINERVLRLADVYLMYAEALIQTGDAGISTAVDYINLVRKRAGVIQLKKADYTTKEAVMNHLMYIERPLELAFEGHSIRWNDLRRWGIVKTWYTSLSGMSWMFPEKEPNSDPIKQFGNSAANFSTDKSFLPIPNEERNRNPFID